MNKNTNEHILDILDLNKLNREQRLAVFLDRHTFISANAGSGKTSVIIKKYLFELLNNPIIDKNPENIVAITFTNKAAGEMAKRVYKSLEDIIDSKQLSDWELNKREFQNIYKNLSKSKISTIHSFCSSIIKEYPIESNLVPGYKEGAMKEIDIAMDEILNQLFKDLINNKENNQDEYNFVAKYGIYSLSKYLKSIYYKREWLYNDDGSIRKLTKDLFDSFKNDYKDYLISRIRIVVDSYDKGLYNNKQEFESTIENTKDKNSKGKSQFNYNLFVSKITELKGILTSQNDNINLEEIIEKLNGLMLCGKIKQSLTHNFLFPFGNVYFDSNEKLKSEINKIIISIKSNLLSDTYNQLTINDTNTFLEIVRRFLELVNNFKYDESLIDFDDVLIIADKLLDHPHILESVRSKTKLLMVDEFQDTSHVQFSIVKKIVGVGDLSNIKLVLVGDEKQSIYEFRNAEIEVFKQSKDFIKEINSDLHISLNGNKKIDEHFIYGDVRAKEDENLGVVELKTSYRMAPYLVSFLNDINLVNFNNATKPSIYDYFKESIIDKNLTNYNEFVFGIKSELINDFSNNCKIEVDVLISESKNRSHKNGNDRDSDNETKEYNENKDKITALVTNRVIKLINDGVSFGSIAIISRKKTYFADIKAKLDEKGIPNVNHSKYNIFHKREIKDIYLYLKFIEDPYNDLNLAGLLRSYFFNFNDSEVLNLYETTTKSGTTSLYEKLEESLSNDNAKNKEVFQFLSNALENNVLFSFSMLIDFLIANSYWNDAVLFLDKENEFSESIRLFNQELQKFQESNDLNLTELLNYMLIQIYSEEKENEEEASIDKNKINILTIHASKGLEFKNVILINLESDLIKENNKNQDIKFSKHLKFPALKLINEENFDDENDSESENIIVGDEEKSNGIIDEYGGIERKIKNMCENVRLFYVALSRAEEGLYLLANLKNTKTKALTIPNNSFIKYLYDYKASLNNSPVNIEKINDKDEYLLKNKKIYVQSLKERKEEFISYKFKFNELSIEDLKLEYNANQEEKFVNENIDLDKEIKIEITKEDFTATKFKNYHTYKPEYFKRYILGAPDFKFISDIKVTDFDDKPLENATERGIIVHYLMENILKWLDDNNELIPEKVEEILNETKVPEDNKQYYFDILNNFVDSLFFKNIIKYKSKFISELSLKLPLEKSYLSCKIDFCFKIDNENIEVWDWKTDRISNEKEFQEKIDIYTYQLKSYVYACYFYFNKPKKITTRLIFLDMLKENDNTENWIFKKEYSENDIPIIEKELIQTLKKVNKLNFGLE